MKALRVLREAFAQSWPFLASFVMVAVLVAAVVSTAAVVGQRDDLARQSKDLRTLVESDRRRLEYRDRNLDAALDKAADLLHQILAQHDNRNTESHDELFRRLAELLSRPVGSVLVRPSTQITAPRTSPTTAPRRTTTTCPQAGKSGRCK